MAFLEFDKSLIVRTLHQINADEKPAWGALSAQGMVEHLTYAKRLSTGDLKKALAIPEKHLDRNKAFLMSDQPMPVEYKAEYITDADLELIHPNMETAITHFEKEWDNFLEHYKEDPLKTELHPVFGSLNFEEWTWLHRKHMHHHLKQFNQID